MNTSAGLIGLISLSSFPSCRAVELVRLLQSCGVDVATDVQVGGSVCIATFNVTPLYVPMTPCAHASLPSCVFAFVRPVLMRLCIMRPCT